MVKSNYQLPVDIIHQLTIDQEPWEDQPMVESHDLREAFASRLNEALDDVPGIRKGHGRNVDLHNRIKDSEGKPRAQATNKWLKGESMPDRGHILVLARLTGRRAEWLEHGVGPERDLESATPHSWQPEGAADLSSVASVRRVPIISSVQAGDWCDAEDPYPVGQGEGSVLVEADKVSASAFAVRCEGPSMEPRFYDGDVLVVDPHREALNGNFVIAKKTSTNSVNFKQLVVEAGEVYLKALNPDWPQRIIKIDEDWHICGVVVHRVEDLV